MEHPIDCTPSPEQPAYRRIAEGIRDEILARKLEPGTRLPTTEELAATWKSNVFTTHKALVTLVKEGWLVRFRGGGTYIADPKNRFVCAGIYYGSDIWSNYLPPFIRSVHESLLEQFGRKKEDVQIFIDSRPEKEQETLLPVMADAILKRRIQCVVAPNINVVNLPALMRLKLPTAFFAYETTPNRVSFSEEAFVRDSVRELAAQGCRSLGLISPVIRPRKDGDSYGRFHAHFRKAVREGDLKTRNEWILTPRQTVNELEKYGYQSFHKLWKLPEKPDGLIVLPDMVSNGVIIAVLEIGIQLVPGRMKFVFHRNSRARYLCPFPVTYAISNEDMLAAELVKMIEKQFRGEKVSPVLLPHVFERS